MLTFVVYLCASISTSYIESLKLQVAELKSHILEHSYCQWKSVLRSEMSVTAELLGLQSRITPLMSWFLFLLFIPCWGWCEGQNIKSAREEAKNKKPACPSSMLAKQSFSSSSCAGLLQLWTAIPTCLSSQSVSHTSTSILFAFFCFKHSKMAALNEPSTSSAACSDWGLEHLRTGFFGHDACIGNTRH